MTGSSTATDDGTVERTPDGRAIRVRRVLPDAVGVQAPVAEALPLRRQLAEPLTERQLVRSDPPLGLHRPCSGYP
jgi:hypothetical protein